MTAAKGRMGESEGRRGAQACGHWPVAIGWHAHQEGTGVGAVTLDPKRHLGKTTKQIIFVFHSLKRDSL